MAPLLISPFKSPISVFSRLKDWSVRKRMREDTAVATTPMLEACRQCSISNAAAPERHSATSFCTPRPGHSLSIATPDSGIQSQPTSAVTDRLAEACSKVSSTPIPICKSNSSCQYRRMKIRSSITTQKSIEVEIDTEYTGGQFTEQLAPQALADNPRRVSTASSISAAAPSEATTTTTITSEASSSTRSDGDSWCLKLSDLDTADCLSPARSSGWVRSSPDYVRARGLGVDSKADNYFECCEIDQGLVVERSERQAEELPMPTKWVYSSGRPKPQVKASRLVCRRFLG